jgi:hypothetical protein
MTALLWMGPSRAQAYPILGQEDWDPVSSASAWTNLYGWTTLATPSAGGYTGGWLQVTFPYTESPESGMKTGWYDVVYMKATNLFAGSWNTNMWVQFDFWASNKSPGAVQVQWQSTNVGDDIWGAAVGTPGTGTWTTLSASFMNWSNWMYDGATEAEYLSDLASIDWIGVYIYRNTADEQIYGIDNFMLMIPEPAECLLLALALMTTGLSACRKRPAARSA